MYTYQCSCENHHKSSNLNFFIWISLIWSEMLFKNLQFYQKMFPIHFSIIFKLYLYASIVPVKITKKSSNFKFFLWISILSEICHMKSSILSKNVSTYFSIMWQLYLYACLCIWGFFLKNILQFLNKFKIFSILSYIS